MIAQAVDALQDREDERKDSEAKDKDCDPTEKDTTGKAAAVGQGVVEGRHRHRGQPTAPRPYNQTTYSEHKGLRTPSFAGCFQHPKMAQVQF